MLGEVIQEGVGWSRLCGAGKLADLGIQTLLQERKAISVIKSLSFARVLAD